MQEIFARNVPDTTSILSRKCVAIAGCGGLGSNAAVALVRAGVGRLILVDYDVVEITNLNRQYFFRNDIDSPKVAALAQHLKAIHPEIKLDIHHHKLSIQDIPELFATADLLIEAFDRAESKKWLIEGWCRNFPDRPIICGNGISGMGPLEELQVIQSGHIIFCGDGYSQMDSGLCGARIAIVANMQAYTALQKLLNSPSEK